MRARRFNLRDIFRRIKAHKHFDRVWMTTPGAASACAWLPLGRGRRHALSMLP